MSRLNRYSILHLSGRMLFDSLRRRTSQLMLVSMLISLPCPGFAQQVVTLTGDPWPPYVEGVLGQEATHGTVVELAKEVFRRLNGVQLSLPMIPWNRALREVEHGTKDGILGLLKTEERERYMIYTEPLFSARSLVWYTKNKFPRGFYWNSINDLAKYKVGVIQGYSYGDEIDSAIQSGDFPVVQVATVDLLFKMLAKERIDIAIENDSVGYALASQSSPEVAILPAEKAIETEVLYIAFSKKSNAQKLIPQINQILSELRKEGFMDRLLPEK